MDYNSLNFPKKNKIMLKMSHMIASQREAKPNNSDDEAQIKKTLLRYSRFLELIKPSKRPVFLGTGP